MKKHLSLLFAISLLTILSMVGLTACGSAQTQAAALTPTGVATIAISTQTIAQPTLTITKTPPTTVPTQPQVAGPAGAATNTALDAQNCGNILAYPNGKLQSPGQAQQAGNCFWQAFQQCHAATLTFQAGGIDTVKTHNLLITRTSNGCSIADKVSFRVIPQPVRTSNYVCTAMTNTSSKLLLTGCGAEQDFSIPLA